MNRVENMKMVVEQSIRVGLPPLLEAVAALPGVDWQRKSLMEAAARCRGEGTPLAARAAYFAAAEALQTDDEATHDAAEQAFLSAEILAYFAYHPDDATYEELADLVMYS